MLPAVMFQMLPVMFRMLHKMILMLPVMFRMLHKMILMLPVTCYDSHVTCEWMGMLR